MKIEVHWPCGQAKVSLGEKHNFQLKTISQHRLQDEEGNELKAWINLKSKHTVLCLSLPSYYYYYYYCHIGNNNIIVIIIAILASIIIAHNDYLDGSK